MELVTALCLAAGLLVGAWLVLHWRAQRRQVAMTRDIPGPPGLPFIGNAHLFMGKITDNLPIALKLFQDYGPLVKGSVGSRYYFLMKDPDDIQVVLGDPKIRNRDHIMTKVIARFFGNGLFSLRGDQWQLHRKLITPTFHFKILECFVEVFGRKSAILMEKLKELDGKTFDAYPVLTLCTLDSICETAIGTAVNSQTVGQSNFADAIAMTMKYIHRRFIRPWLLVDFIYALSWDGRQSKPLVNITHAFSESVIAQKLSEYRRGVRSPGITTASNKRVSSFLDMLIEASESQGSILSPEEMRDEVTTMAAAGVDTTANTMCFLLVLVALDTKVQAELHKELDEVFGSDDRAATPEDLQRLPVLDRCIKETMRLFPVASVLPREIDEDLRLPSGHTLPAGSCVIILSYATHRDPRYYPEPEEFRPDRWLPEKLKAIHPYAYLPFSAGPRNCIGQKYAQLQMKSIIGQVLRRYHVRTELTMKELLNLELSMTISLDQELGERYRIRLHER